MSRAGPHNPRNTLARLRRVGRNWRAFRRWNQRGFLRRCFWERHPWCPALVGRSRPASQGPDDGDANRAGTGARPNREAGANHPDRIDADGNAPGAKPATAHNHQAGAKTGPVSDGGFSRGARRPPPTTGTSRAEDIAPADRRGAQEMGQTAYLRYVAPIVVLRRQRKDCHSFCVAVAPYVGLRTSGKRFATARRQRESGPCGLRRRIRLGVRRRRRHHRSGFGWRRGQAPT